MKKILYISYDGMTDSLGQSQVLPYLTGLSNHGFQFHLISFEKSNRFALHREHIQALCDAAGITWHPKRYTKKPPLFSTIWDVQRMRRLANELHAEHHFQFVHCRSYIPALVGLGMKKKLGIKFLFDMRGFWADERIDGRIWNIKNPLFNSIYSYFKRKEITFFKEADHTISLTYNGKEAIQSWEVLQRKKPAITVIPCCVDLELFNPTKYTDSQREALRQKLGIQPGDFLLGYVGSIGTWYMLPEMLTYFSVLKGSFPNAKFLFVTNELPVTILKDVTRLGLLQDDFIITSCLHAEVPLHISLFDLSVFFIQSTYSKKASSPTKQGEIMAMGVPLVCNPGVGDTDLVVKKYKAGYVTKELSTQAYIDSLSYPEFFDAQQTIEGARAFYGLEEGVKRYLEVYEFLLEKK
jgi:glycosyltransferase involved in cell wall biosynthesis